MASSLARMRGARRAPVVLGLFCMLAACTPTNASGSRFSKAFATMSVKEEDAHNDLTGIDENQLKVLDDWYNKLTGKYATVGRVG